ncbi:hypothetical protein ALP73_200112 [Pseudomonas coronafaciens pv. garcae]|uniref:Uncharacterized protein n=3 Tax=Pseudomonas syringae group TaxID=136849 RepID=A0AB37QVV8_9PSED|nr:MULTISPECIES: hypothetical protein [Pseudomonas syringae group]KPB98061.1 Uncharacterized protein AC503_2417 [Pseudomonas syringae pv. maculicola]MBM0212088.1 hypothetical protein [Pseudomonas syringae pv. maculicola]MBN4180613.1 hypothetical protein [Pseudomonas savastanoi pv. phaseolicola]RMM78061.1 hypothetical protein ALQ72_05388 [Pseudomonas syringae pv. maculicola]RMS05342.1 hypothetical protein ALP73_200112 [Pseudomonas coronafaciens pv. garcae]
MSNTINHLPTTLLKLPVVLTPSAWNESVHLEAPSHIAEVGTRLGDVVLEAYRELRLQPDATQIDFGIYRFPPNADRSFGREWLELKLHRIDAVPGNSYLCISLRDEKPLYLF